MHLQEHSGVGLRDHLCKREREIYIYIYLFILVYVHIRLSLLYVYIYIYGELVFCCGVLGTSWQFSKYLEPPSKDLRVSTSNYGVETLVEMVCEMPYFTVEFRV